MKVKAVCVGSSGESGRVLLTCAELLGLLLPAAALLCICLSQPAQPPLKPNQTQNPKSNVMHLTLEVVVQKTLFSLHLDKKQNSEKQGVARERFELSSEGPKPSMLDHYTTGLPANLLVLGYLMLAFMVAFCLNKRSCVVVACLHGGLLLLVLGNLVFFSIFLQFFHGVRFGYVCFLEGYVCNSFNKTTKLK